LLFSNIKDDESNSSSIDLKYEREIRRLETYLFIVRLCQINHSGLLFTDEVTFLHWLVQLLDFLSISWLVRFFDLVNPTDFRVALIGQICSLNELLAHAHNDAAEFAYPSHRLVRGLALKTALIAHI
jgi:hypothetical protein